MFSNSALTDHLNAPSAKDLSFSTADEGTLESGCTVVMELDLSPISESDDSEDHGLAVTSCVGCLQLIPATRVLPPC